ncbi:MAG: hypothetical protein P8Y12_10215 [Gammaproteobacteria bacterium]|jgi:hypothetical protein
MAKKKSAKRKKVSKSAKRVKKSDNDESLGLNEAICSMKQGGIKIEAICSLNEVSACVGQLREALAAPIEETDTAVEEAKS